MIYIKKPSKIFIIIDDSNNEYYILKNIENSVIYHLMKKHEFFEFSFNKNDMIEKAYYAAKIDGSIDIVIFETYLFDSKFNFPFL